MIFKMEKIFETLKVQHTPPTTSLPLDDVRMSPTLKKSSPRFHGNGILQHAGGLENVRKNQYVSTSSSKKSLSKSSNKSNSNGAVFGGVAPAHQYYGQQQTPTSSPLMDILFNKMPPVVNNNNNQKNGDQLYFPQRQHSPTSVPVKGRRSPGNNNRGGRENVSPSFAGNLHRSSGGHPATNRATPPMNHQHRSSPTNYAGPKFIESPSPSSLPLPPVHWLQAGRTPPALKVQS